MSMTGGSDSHFTSRETRITGFDNGKQAYLVSIKARAEDNKANMEVVKFLSKTLKKRVRICSGLRSREKIIGFV